jgi:imidazolonepropionase-like amidohydrolase
VLTRIGESVSRPGTLSSTNPGKAEYPTATVLPGLIDTHVILLRTVRWVPWIASRYGDEELDAVITEELRRQLAAGVTARDLGDLRYAVVNRRDVQRAGRTREPEPTIVASGPPLATELRSVQLPRPQGPTTSTATGNKRPATTLPSSTPPLPATPTTRP